MSGLQYNAERCNGAAMLDKVNDAVAAELRAAQARANLSGPKVAAAAGIPAMYAYRRLAGLVEISVSDLVTLCAGIGVYPLDVLAQALTVPAADPPPVEELDPAADEPAPVANGA